jgi:hypothetical protein
MHRMCASGGSGPRRAPGAAPRGGAAAMLRSLISIAAATLPIQVVVIKTERAPDRANIDKRSVVKFGGCASQVD